MFEVSIIDQATDPSGPPADSNVLASLQRSCPKRTPLPVLPRRDCGRSRPRRGIRNRSRAPVLGLVLVLFSITVLLLKIGPDFGTSQYIYVLAVPVLVLNSGPDFGLAKTYKTGTRPRQIGARSRVTSACSAAAADCKKEQLFCTSDLSQNVTKGIQRASHSDALAA